MTPVKVQLANKRSKFSRQETAPLPPEKSIPSKQRAAAVTHRNHRNNGLTLMTAAG